MVGVSNREIKWYRQQGYLDTECDADIIDKFYAAGYTIKYVKERGIAYVMELER